MSERDDSIHRLEGSSNQVGGLIIKKKASDNNGKASFKMPQPRSSLLGLDRLAAAKRKEKEELEDESRKRSKVTSYKDDWEGGDDDDDDDDDEDENEKGSSHKSSQKRYK